MYLNQLDTKDAVKIESMVFTEVAPNAMLVIVLWRVLLTGQNFELSVYA